jgi:hypothetical protein
MNKIRIYRVVDENGDGMYRPSGLVQSLWDQVNASTDAINHPTLPDDDAFIKNIPDYIVENCDRFNDPDELYEEILEAFGMLAFEPVKYRILGDLFESLTSEYSRQFVFGFLDKRQYLKWVYDPQWRYDMTLRGGKLQVWEIDESRVLSGESQLIFFESDATLVDELDPSFFDENAGQEMKNVA